jgi:hypothetical protein
VLTQKGNNCVKVSCTAAYRRCVIIKFMWSILHESEYKLKGPLSMKTQLTVISSPGFRFSDSTTPVSVHTSVCLSTRFPHPALHENY